MATTTDTGRKYRVGFGEAADGTWMKGGWNVTVHGHKVIQRLVIARDTTYLVEEVATSNQIISLP